MQVHSSVLDLIGNTPMIELKNIRPDLPHRFFAKAEYLNPGGSVKDRICLELIEKAEQRGDLKEGGLVIEATSGNTGIGLALIAAVKGYGCKIVMPEKMSKEKIDLIRSFGAEVILTPTGVAADDPRSHYSVAKKLAADTPNSFYANQFHNPDNFETHYKTTAPEIWQQLDGKVDYLIHGAGTGGTISGCGKFLKEKKPDVKIVLADPVGSILHDLFHYKEIREEPKPYLIEGIGEDMLPENVRFEYIDDSMQFTDKEAMLLCRELLNKEGLFVGPSSAAPLCCAFRIAEKIQEPKNFVTFLCDNGDRYLSKVFNDDWMRENHLLEE
tara:strand:- start:8298 stop:9278 length:981 start_codon:yes stop_codon:yes gene_type:complete